MKTILKGPKLSGVSLVLTLWIGCAAGTEGGVAQTVAPAPADAKAASTAHPESGPKLNDKQKALADQADKLLVMATELKNQVDRTNKNILSVKVVEKAEEIERYAHQIKDQAKK
jgi:type VI protein secretion system component VasF